MAYEKRKNPLQEHPLMGPRMPGWAFRAVIFGAAFLILLVILAASDGAQNVETEDSLYRTIPSEQLHQAQ